MPKPLLFFVPLFVAAALSAGDASAADETIALGEVAVPPASSGVDQASLALAARGELRSVDASRVPNPKRRNVVVSVAIIGSTPSPFACTINAMLRDAKTGTMLAVIEGRARSEGNVSPEVRKQVLHAALRSAVRQIPDALAAN
jgi:hypothetical protein